MADDIDDRFGGQPPDDTVANLRKPPHSIEAEQAVLGALMVDTKAMADVAQMLEAGDFYRYEHNLIFSAIGGLAADGVPADMISVFERLQAQGKADECGGLKYLNQLEAGVTGSQNIVRHAQIVAERSTLRALISAAEVIGTSAFNTQGRAAADVIDEAKVSLGRVAERCKGSGKGIPVLGLESLQRHAASVRWLVKHVVPADSVGMLFGASGTFKSFLAIDMALHVARGMRWLGRKTEKGPVLYIAAEGGAGLWKRIEAWHKARNLDWTRTQLFVVPVAVDLTTEAWRVVEAAQMAGITPSLVIVDTLSQTYSGEENSANEMAAYLREIGSRFRALWHCSVLLIHHTGHIATERPRGSSAIRGNLDFMFGCHRDDKERIATLSCAKQKDDEEFDDAPFQLTVQELGRDADGDRITALVASHIATTEELAEAQAAEMKAGRGGKGNLLLSLAQNGQDFKALRKAFYEDCGIDDPESQRRAFNRALTKAKTAKQIEIVEGIVVFPRSKT